MQQQGAGTYGFTGSQGSLTSNASTATIATLNEATGKTWFSSVVTARFQKAVSADNCGLVARFQDVNNYYRVDFSNNLMTISKVSGGTATTLTPTGYSFTDGGSKYWIKLMVQGFGLGGTSNNIQAKIWADGASEPASYQLAVSDTSGVLQLGSSGVRMKGNSGSNFQYVDSFSAMDSPQITPAPIYNVT